MVPKIDVQQAIQALGLARQPLCVHASLHSFGWVDGGADAIIDGILAAGCTLLVLALVNWLRC